MSPSDRRETQSVPAAVLVAEPHTPGSAAGAAMRPSCPSSRPLSPSSRLDWGHRWVAGPLRTPVLASRLVGHTRGRPGPRRASRTSALKLEMLLRENAVAEHKPRTGLHGMLRQESGCELSGRFPNPRLQARIKTGKLGPQSHLTNPAIYLCQSFPFPLVGCAAHLMGPGSHRGTQSARAAAPY